MTTKSSKPVDRLLACPSLIRVYKTVLTMHMYISRSWTPTSGDGRSRLAGLAREMLVESQSSETHQIEEGGEGAGVMRDEIDRALNGSVRRGQPAARGQRSERGDDERR